MAVVAAAALEVVDLLGWVAAAGRLMVCRACRGRWSSGAAWLQCALARCAALAATMAMACSAARRLACARALADVVKQLFSHFNTLLATRVVLYRQNMVQ